MRNVHLAKRRRHRCLLVLERWAKAEVGFISVVEGICAVEEETCRYEEYVSKASLEDGSCRMMMMMAIDSTVEDRIKMRQDLSEGEWRNPSLSVRDVH